MKPTEADVQTESRRDFEAGFRMCFRDYNPRKSTTFELNASGSVSSGKLFCELLQSPNLEESLMDIPHQRSELARVANLRKLSPKLQFLENH